MATTWPFSEAPLAAAEAMEMASDLRALLGGQSFMADVLQQYAVTCAALHMVAVLMRQSPAGDPEAP